MSLSPGYMLSQKWHELNQKDTDFYMELQWKAVPKGRPRVGKNSVYTPKRTRDFEKKVRDAAKTVKRGPFTCPVKVFVTISEPIPKSYTGMKRAAAKAELINPPVGDLDNKVKAITDALNGIAYMDDRQIVHIDAKKFFGVKPMIVVTVSRAGLSLGEVENVSRR